MQTIYDVIIIGAGPAGMAAAVYAKRAGLNTLILEKTGMNGGQVLNTYEVDNYPGLPGISGFDLCMKMKEHVDKFEVPTEAVTVESLMEDGPYKKVVTNEGQFVTKTVVIAAGAYHAHLNVPGEEELAGMGVSYCATCDGAFFKGRTVAVVGGGDVAIEDAIFLARGCEKVYLIHRRDEFRAAKSLQEALKKFSNVEILYDHVVEEIKGEDQVEELWLSHTKSGEKKNLLVQGVFIAVGTIPDSDVFKTIVETDKKGYIIAGEDGVTSVPGIFVAGDVRTKKLRQIITAAADGANAVTSAEQYISEAF